MYLCVRGIVTKPVPIQESERSCICVLGVQESDRSCICVLRVQESDRSGIYMLGVQESICVLGVTGHVFVC